MNKGYFKVLTVFPFLLQPYLRAYRHPVQVGTSFRAEEREE
jgi:hypothetical protein